MIDIESEIFSQIAEATAERFPKLTLTNSEILGVPQESPTASIVEADNYTYDNTVDSGSNENHAVVMFEVNVFSNKVSEKKTECKQIMSFIDEMMLNMGFSRTMKQPYKTDDATWCRLVCRYRGIVSKNKEIFRR